MKENMSYAEGKALVMHSMDRLRMVGLIDYSVLLYILYLCRHRLLNVSNSDYNRENPLGHINSILEHTSDIENSDVLIEIFRIFREDLESINSHIFTEIVSLHSQLNNNWFDDYYVTIFEELLLKISSNQNSYEFIQPTEITKLISELSGYKQNEFVYNPFAGAASYAVGMNISSEYYAQELNPKVWAIGTLRLLAHNIKIDNYVCQNSIQHADYAPFFI